jgi:hypothetical protein
LDVVIHDASNPNGSKVTSMSWSNPLTVSLISGKLNVSSSAGTFDYGFPSFPLAYITTGSTNKSYACYGGEVLVRAIPKPTSNNVMAEVALVVVVVAATLAVLAVVVYEKKRIRHMPAPSKNDASTRAINVSHESKLISMEE